MAPPLPPSTSAVYTTSAYSTHPQTAGSPYLPYQSGLPQTHNGSQPPSQQSYGAPAPSHHQQHQRIETTQAQSASPSMAHLSSQQHHQAQPQHHQSHHLSQRPPVTYGMSAPYQPSMNTYAYTSVAPHDHYRRADPTSGGLPSMRTLDHSGLPAAPMGHAPGMMLMGSHPEMGYYNPPTVHDTESEEVATAAATAATIFYQEYVVPFFRTLAAVIAASATLSFSAAPAAVSGFVAAGSAAAFATLIAGFALDMASSGVQSSSNGPSFGHQVQSQHHSQSHHQLPGIPSTQPMSYKNTPSMGVSSSYSTPNSTVVNSSGYDTQSPTTAYDYSSSIDPALQSGAGSNGSVNGGGNHPSHGGSGVGSNMGAQPRPGLGMSMYGSSEHIQQPRMVDHLPHIPTA
ncbi:White-opaque regulator 1 [Ceratocystis lukuohia]|uniref:White-opaque regulator 1 n=1 Tax=Ceratocystis lukuohia TaxID=2019550 RepID=A0ABR4MM21_9PEZI